jgi:hypothetical protein
MAEALRAVEPGLTPDPLTSSFHNPWPDRVDDLFSFLGMERPSRTISWQKAGNAAVRANLEKLVRTRNRIAHGSTGVVVRKHEVTSFRRYVEGFSLRFDRLVRRRVRELTGSYPWTL